MRRCIPLQAVLTYRALSERKRAGIAVIIDDAVESGLLY
jgi:hypothetical protein